MPVKVTDDMGREVVFMRPPRRIVSLVPSDTYSVCALGAGDRLVGRTSFCVEPADEVETVTVVGGTKNVDVDMVVGLAPDLILANQEENARAPLEQLADRRLPLFVSFPRRVAEGVSHLGRLARMLGLAEAPAARAVIQEAYRSLLPDRETTTVRAGLPQAFVPIWREPLMTFNDDTFAADMLLQMGLANAFDSRQRQYPLAADLGRRSPIAADRLGDRDRRYPRLTAEEVVARAPEVMLVPDEPYPFASHEVAELAALDTPAGRAGRVAMVSGRDLFWYGARAAQALPRLRSLVLRLTRGQ